jgi:prepilin-type N-terminal cleavage/methylation domain-containing protein
MLRKLRQKMRRAQDQKGFTLVELMVVVVILGILVAIAVPLYNAQTEKVKKATCQANQRIIESAIVQWSMDPENAGIPKLDDLVNGGYLQSKPKCPSNNDPSNNDTYEIVQPAGSVTWSVTCTEEDDHNED